MAGGEGDAEAEANLRGLSKYFNSITMRGRANVAKLTYAVCFGLGMLLWLKPKKPAPAPPPPPPSRCSGLTRAETCVYRPFGSDCGVKSKLGDSIVPTGSGFLGGKDSGPSLPSSPPDVSKVFAKVGDALTTGAGAIVATGKELTGGTGNLGAPSASSPAPSSDDSGSCPAESDKTSRFT